MSALRWIPPILLALVLAASAGTKLASPSRTEASFRGLGLKGAGVLAIVVPGVELLTAAALVAAPRVGGVLALGLLGVFSAFLHRVITRGSAAPCACFGQVRQRSVSRATLARNAMLSVLAVLAIVAPPA